MQTNTWANTSYFLEKERQASCSAIINNTIYVFGGDAQGSYEKIIVTGFPDNVRPWDEFFVGEGPKNIELTDLKCASDDSFVSEEPKKLLAVDSWQCSPESKIKDGLPIKILEKIYRPDKSEAFIFVTRLED